MVRLRAGRDQRLRKRRASLPDRLRLLSSTQGTSMDCRLRSRRRTDTPAHGLSTVEAATFRWLGADFSALGGPTPLLLFRPRPLVGPYHGIGSVAACLRMAPPNPIKGAYTHRRTQGSMLQLSSSLGRALPSAKAAPFPSFIEPCLATLRGSVPNGGAYVHELKFDGYRIQAHLHQGRVTLYTRSGFDWTKRFATVAADVALLPAEELVLDGEIICADPDGRPNFSALQDDLKRGRHDRFVYYAFDLLHLNGVDARPAPLTERKRVLQSILAETRTTAPRVLYSEHFEDGAALYAQATNLGLEGIISKRADSPYRSGRGEQWIKVKCWKHERFAVVGFVPEGSAGLLKLRLARRQQDGLIYVGRVGTGWDRKAAQAVRRALEPLPRRTPPLAIKKADTIWVEPRFDVEITYAEITDDGMLRHPVFKSLMPLAGGTSAA
jgi:bifunctional non-homologous end joining protein LigD